MIQKIIKLRNVGLFEQGLPNGPLELGTVTLIYAENARGKSTFAAVMRACSLGDSGRMSARKTIDSASGPEFSILVPSGSGQLQIEYQNDRWNYSYPCLVVFDSEFIEQNVYSGLEVRPDQRQALLEYALGDQTVQLKKRVDQITKDIEAATKRRGDAEKALISIAVPFTAGDFVALNPIHDVEDQVDALRRRRDAARNEQPLIKRQDPVTLPLIELDIETVFDILGKRLADIEESAEAIVLSHLATHDDMGIEDWISQGQRFAIREKCPFCGQPLAGIELVRAYRSFFDQAYADLKKEVEAIESDIASAAGDPLVEALRLTKATNSARVEAWKDQMGLDVPELDTDKIRQDLQKARHELFALTSRKRQQPLESVGLEANRKAIMTVVESINSSIIDYNSRIATVSQSITSFKKALTGEDIQVLETDIKKLEAVQRRQLPDVVALISDYQSAVAKRTDLEAEKVEARDQIDTQMDSTLEQYGKAINRLLESFGAKFSIGRLKPSYVGSGEPRTDYGLVIRNCLVKLGTRTDLSGGHSFGTTLSDGDRRSLAFAFFCARLEDDPHIADKTVIIDDPVSSLDGSRRYKTIQYLVNFASRCRQLIVLSHNAYFVRDLRDQLTDARPTPIVAVVASIHRVQNDYSAFGECDIDAECASDYYRHHSLVWDFHGGMSKVSIRDVAKAIRPLLEGYYHRRFPKQLPKGMRLGQIIDKIRNAESSNPINHLTQILIELTDVNKYGCQFHHDTNVDSDSVVVNDTELLGFACRTLDLIHKNG